jgi:hypothetical protein
MKKIWRLWAKAIGPKEGNSESEADVIAVIRTAIVVVYLITNFVIVAGVIRHWDDNEYIDSSMIFEKNLNYDRAD